MPIPTLLATAAAMAITSTVGGLATCLAIPSTVRRHSVLSRRW